MVVKMMRWPPWPPLLSRKFQAVIVIHRLEGLHFDKEKELENEKKRLVVEVKWKGQKIMALSSLRRSVRRSFTEEGGEGGDGIVEWNEEFITVCNFSGFKEGVFFPWEVAFTVFNGLNKAPRTKVPFIGTALVDLAEFASAAEEKIIELNVPLKAPTGNIDNGLSLHFSLRLVALESSQAQQRSVVPVPFSPNSTEALSTEKVELSAVRAGLRKVKIFTDYVSTRKDKKKCREEENSDGRCSVRSEDAESNSPLDTDSLDGDAEGESEESREDSSIPQPFSYETLAIANWTGVSFYSDMVINAEDEGWIYYGNHKSDMDRLHVENSTGPACEHSSQRSSKRKILPWRKRKLSFRSSKVKGEPLLKKCYGEEGGDDIDFDRRQISSSDESSFGWSKSEAGASTTRSSDSEFGDDHFSVGNWEHKEVISRDGHMKLKGQVFFASIDQRSERAAGESACTALVAAIAHWLQSNQKEMPNKSEFDSLIREGSSEWRNLCENKDYIEQFPDKHLDLETVLQAKIRPLSVVSEKSFIGFFHPEGLEEGNFDFLHGAMSFDSIWDEISCGSDNSCNGDPSVYIISWNDHFFILKVERDAYYIIDTLGERLYEGCNQAYVLEFNKDTMIVKVPEEAKTSEEKSRSDKVQPINSKKNSAEENLEVSRKEAQNSEIEEEIVCRGKESCKEYIKSFLAAIPIRELQDDVKKGLIASTPLHHRLQIEFHYTHLLQQGCW